MRANARRFLLAVVLAAAWLGLNVAFPDLGPTGIPTAVTRLIIHGIILVGLWLGLTAGALWFWTLLAVAV